MTPPALPALVRIKPGALDKLGAYLLRAGYSRVAVLASDGLPGALTARAGHSLVRAGVDGGPVDPVPAGSFEWAAGYLARLPAGAEAVVGVGGPTAVDAAKYVAFLAGRPFVAVPTCLAADGFGSPRATLTLAGRRRVLPAALPAGVVVDTAACLAAPVELWHSGVGELAATLTAGADWRLAAQKAGAPVHDLAALLADGPVTQFLARPARDAEGARVLATALLLNGVASAVAGSPRPARGAEHLIAAALDAGAGRPRRHGLTVGLATYFVSRLQGGRHTPWVAGLFAATGFWDSARADPVPAGEWVDAVRRAPGLAAGYHTVLSERDCVPEVARLVRDDPAVRGCFAG